MRKSFIFCDDFANKIIMNLTTLKKSFLGLLILFSCASFVLFYVSINTLVRINHWVSYGMVGNNTDGLTHNSTRNSKATNRINNLVTVRRVGDNVDRYTHKPTVIRPSLIVHNVTARKIVTAISKTDSKKQLRLPSGTTSPSSMKKPVNRPSFIVDNVTARKIETTISKTDSTKQLRLPSGTSLSSVKKSDKVSCLAKECVAIVVPYRDRKEHLSIFMTEIERFLRQQNITFYIFIIEQSSNGPFNRAKLFNVGFNESRLISNFSCYIFHDVDLIPISPYNQYHCGTNPIHMAVGIEKYGFRLPYPVYTGGVLAMTSDQFQRMNGFSNVYFGWGGEDDDIERRIRAAGFRLTRPTIAVGRYKSLGHTQAQASPIRWKLLRDAGKRIATDGINSVNYTLLSRTIDGARMHVIVDIGRA